MFDVFRCLVLALSCLCRALFSVMLLVRCHLARFGRMICLRVANLPILKREAFNFLHALDLENTTNLRWGFLGRSLLMFLQASSSRCFDGLDYDDALLHRVA